MTVPNNVRSGDVASSASYNQLLQSVRDLENADPPDSTPPTGGQVLRALGLGNPSSSNSNKVIKRNSGTGSPWFVYGDAASGGGLSEVDSDGTLTGDGTSGDPLKVANPFTDADEAKLDGIAAGAEVNVQADWNQSSSSADSFIRNKPSIPASNRLIPSGGTTGQVLKKTSNSDYAVGWRNDSTGSGNGGSSSPDPQTGRNTVSIEALRQRTGDIEEQSITKSYQLTAVATQGGMQEVNSKPVNTAAAVGHYGAADGTNTLSVSANDAANGIQFIFRIPDGLSLTQYNFDGLSHYDWTNLELIGSGGGWQYWYIPVSASADDNPQAFAIRMQIDTDVRYRWEGDLTKRAIDKAMRSDIDARLDRLEDRTHDISGHAGRSWSNTAVATQGGMVETASRNRTAQQAAAALSSGGANTLNVGRNDFADVLYRLPAAADSTNFRVGLPSGAELQFDTRLGAVGAWQYFAARVVNNTDSQITAAFQHNANDYVWEGIAKAEKLIGSIAKAVVYDAVKAIIVGGTDDDTAQTVTLPAAGGSGGRDHWLRPNTPNSILGTAFPNMIFNTGRSDNIFLELTGGNARVIQGGAPTVSAGDTVTFYIRVSQSIQLRRYFYDGGGYTNMTAESVQTDLSTTTFGANSNGLRGNPTHS